MTRTEALTIITNALQTVDDATLEAAAAHIAHHAQPTGVTFSDIQEAFAAESVLPRTLTERELALVARSKEDFRFGRTLTSVEMWSSLDEQLVARGVRRSTL